MSNPKAPKVVGVFNDASVIGMTIRVVPGTNTLIVLNCDGDVPTAPGNITAIDATNPAALVRIGQLQLSSAPQDLNGVIVGNYLYCAYRDSTETHTFFVVNIADPTNMTVAGQTTLAGSSNAVAVCGDYAYLPDNTNNKIYVVTISTPATPTLANTISLAYSPWVIAPLAPGAVHVRFFIRQQQRSRLQSCRSGYSVRSCQCHRCGSAICY